MQASAQARHQLSTGRVLPLPLSSDDADAEQLAQVAQSAVRRLRSEAEPVHLDVPPGRLPQGNQPALLPHPVDQIPADLDGHLQTAAVEGMRGLSAFFVVTAHKSSGQTEGQELQA